MRMNEKMVKKKNDKRIMMKKIKMKKKFNVNTKHH